MGISIKGMPIVADSFTITVSLILLRYTVVRIRYLVEYRGLISVGSTQPYQIGTLVWVIPQY